MQGRTSTEISNGNGSPDGGRESNMQKKKKKQGYLSLTRNTSTETMLRERGAESHLIDNL